MAEELSKAQLAKRLLASRKAGVVATNSKRMAGYPFATLVPYALDEKGQPFFVMSGLAVHTKNLKEDARASLLVYAQGAEDDPLTAARLTLLGQIGEVAEEEDAALRAEYVQQHPEAAEWIEFGDFRVFRMKVEDVYYIGGFGAMGWVSAKDIET